MEKSTKSRPDTPRPRGPAAASRAEILAAICGRFFSTVLYAFGSRAKEARTWLRGETASMAPNKSDLDVGVLPMSGFRLSARERAELVIQLEDLFLVNRVDLVILPEAPPFLASTIVQGERLFALNEDEADEYDLYVLRKAGDLLPFHKERVRLILGGSG